MNSVTAGQRDRGSDGRADGRANLHVNALLYSKQSYAPTIRCTSIAVWVIVQTRVFSYVKTCARPYPTLSLFKDMLAINSTFATSTDQDQPAHLCRLIMVCTVIYLVTDYFEMLP
jgi:hypothetical protein